ncbi:MAG: hypothetical protein V4850_24780 [Myxococcota bacterium]
MVSAHTWHCFNDTWYSSVPGSVAHVLVAITIATMAFRTSALLGALVLLGQPALLAAALGILFALRTPEDLAETHVVYRFQFGPDEGCYLEPDTRLLSCRAISYRGCVAPLFDYTPVHMAAANFAERAAHALWGPPSTSYFGPLPTPAQLRDAARAAPPTMFHLDAAADAETHGITNAHAADLQWMALGEERPADAFELRITPLGADLLVISTADLSWGQLRFVGAEGGTVPGYRSVNLTRETVLGDQRAW